MIQYTRLSECRYKWPILLQSKTSVVFSMLNAKDHRHRPPLARIAPQQHPVRASGPPITNALLGRLKTLQTQVAWKTFSGSKDEKKPAVSKYGKRKRQTYSQNISFQCDEKTQVFQKIIHHHPVYWGSQAAGCIPPKLPSDQKNLRGFAVFVQDRSWDMLDSPHSKYMGGHSCGKWSMSNWGRYSSHTAGAKQSMVVCGSVSCHSDFIHPTGKVREKLDFDCGLKTAKVFFGKSGLVFDLWNPYAIRIRFSSFGCAPPVWNYKTG